MELCRQEVAALKVSFELRHLRLLGFRGELEFFTEGSLQLGDGQSEGDGAV